MKRVLLLALTIMCIASLAWSQDVGSAGTLGCFADQAGSGCNITDVQYANFDVYVLHYNAVSANSSQFRIEMDPTLTVGGTPAWTKNPNLISLGDIFTGITITYVGCKTTFPLLLGTLSMFGLGASTSCHWVRPAPDPGAESGKVEIVDCVLVKHPVDYVLTAWIANAGVESGCPCSVGTEPTSWSKIKSLYR